MPRVGIYAPTYNVGKYVKEMIHSISSQSYKDWVLGIVDDCSTDDTMEKLDIKNDRIIIKQNQLHIGKIGKIKNETISLFEKQPEFYCSVDSDDIIPNYAIELFVNYMDKNPHVGALCGNFVCFDESGKKWSYPHVTNTNNFDSNILLQYMCMFPLRFYRREFYEQVGGYDNDLTSAIDYDLALKLDEVCKIERIKEPITYLYRQHSVQISSRERPEQDLNAKTALKNALTRRNINAKIINDKPPFKLEFIEKGHFIWGKK